MSIDLSYTKPIDLHAIISPNRLVGLWRMMKGFRLSYLGATISLTIAALARTSTYLLIRYLVDEVLTKGRYGTPLLLVAVSFVLLAVVEGTFSFMSGRLASLTAEGITRRLRNYMFDHIQRLSYSYHSKTPTGELIQRSTSDVDALRRFFADQAINIGRVVILFTINFTTVHKPESYSGLGIYCDNPIYCCNFGFFLQKNIKSVRGISGTRSNSLYNAARKFIRGACG